MIILEDITMREFKAQLKKTRTIVFPFGTIEEHGTHLPLGTDSFIVYAALKVVGEKKRFFLAPLLYYGVCTTTRDHPGTLSISPGALRHIVSDLVRDGHRKGLRNFLMISGHGGSLHMSAIKETAEELVEVLPDIRIAAFSPYDLLWKGLSEIAETQNDSHAGEIETSLMLYLRPELVKGRSREEYPAIPRPFIVRDKVRHWPGGVWGDPSKASLEKGRKAFALIVAAISDVIDAAEKR